MLLASGFRPFFLLAGLAAVSLLPIWLAALSGAELGVDVHWHSHELLLGFAGALLTGFFLTAVPKWTGSTPVTGAPLGALVGLWLVARVGRLAWPSLPLDALFLSLVALQIAFVILRSRSVRNGWFPLLLLCLAGADVVLHIRPEHALVAERVAAFSVVAVIVVFGGRITPLFSRGALKGLATVREPNLVDRLAVASALLLVPLAVWPEPALVVAVAGLGALLHAARMVGWGGSAALGKPILLVLHVGYAWVAVAMALWAVAAWRPDLVYPATALHALTVGVLGTFSLGMMSRVTLGHTGRPLRVGRLMALAYAAMVLAGLLRVFGALSPSRPLWVLHASGSLWVLAFGIFLLRFAPRLLAPRVDGKPG